MRSSVEKGQVFTIDLARDPAIASLADLLHTGNPVELARELIDPRFAPEPLGGQIFLAPIDRQEIWAAGVTYKRSKIAREEESRGAAQFYDKVYTADRPELFLKATPERLVDPGEPVRVRADSKWRVPEPELALVISPAGKIVGYTIGNDMSARDIEGENPLYLPQAKIYQAVVCRRAAHHARRRHARRWPESRSASSSSRGRQDRVRGEHHARADGPHHREPGRLALPRERLPQRRDPA